MNQVIGPIRWWVRLYTAGLPPGIRDERRAEIESDLWEQSCSAAERGFGRVGFALAIWSRWLLGIADDLTWRAEQRTRRQRPPRDGEVAALGRPGASRRRLLGLGFGVTIALALVSLAVVVNTIEYREGTQPSGQVAAILVALVAAIAAVGSITVARGFWIMRARPAEGAILAVGGSFVVGLAWYWLFAPVILAMLISVLGVWRAMRLIDAGATP